jgi:hypothetical protein
MNTVGADDDSPDTVTEIDLMEVRQVKASHILMYLDHQSNRFDFGDSEIDKSVVPLSEDQRQHHVYPQNHAACRCRPSRKCASRNCLQNP